MRTNVDIICKSLQFLAIILVVSLLFAMYMPVCKADCVQAPQSTSPKETLDLKIENGCVERYCDNGIIDKAAGYKYDSDKQLWLIKHSVQGHFWVNHRALNDIKLRQLLDYIECVDKCVWMNRDDRDRYVTNAHELASQILK